MQGWLASLALAGLVLFAPSQARAQGQSGPVPSDPVVQSGAGARDYGRAVDDGGIAPLSQIQGNDRAVLDQKEAALEATRFPGPLVLADEELHALLADRGGPSVSIGSGGQAFADNFEKATRLVNDYVRTGAAITLERIDAINKALLAGTDKDAQAGLSRDKTGEHHFDMWTHRDFGAAPDLVGRYLADFVTWHQAAEAKGTAPLEIAAAAYQQLVRIHPYIDANGRTTRLVMDWVLQAHGLPPATFERDAKTFEAIHKSTAELAKNTADAVLSAAKKLADLPSFVARLVDARAKDGIAWDGLVPRATDSTTKTSTSASTSTSDPSADVMAKIRARGASEGSSTNAPSLGIDRLIDDAVKGEATGAER